MKPLYIHFEKNTIANLSEAGELSWRDLDHFPPTDGDLAVVATDEERTIPADARCDALAGRGIVAREPHAPAQRDKPRAPHPDIVLVVKSRGKTGAQLREPDRRVDDEVLWIFCKIGV